MISLRLLLALFAIVPPLSSGVAAGQDLGERIPLSSDVLGTSPGLKRKVRIPCGGVVTASIKKPGRSVSFVFKGSVGQIVDLTLVKAEGSFVDSFPRAALISAEGEIGTFNGTGLGTFVLPQTGRYVVRVSADAAGTFHLGLGCRPPRTGTALQYGELRSDHLGRPAQLDYFTFNGMVADVARISLVETGGFASSTPRVTLFAPSGANLGTFDADNLVEFGLPEAGTYTLRVAANTFIGTGSYTIGVYAAPPLGNPITLQCGIQEVASIPTPGGVDYFVFDGVLDDEVEITLVSLGDFSTAIPQLRLFSPGGDDLGTFSADSLTQFKLPETGTYAVEVRASSLIGTGSFTIALNCPPPLAPGIPLMCAGAVQGALSTSGEVDYYSFAGVANDTADITLNALIGFPNSTPQMRVFSPSGLDLGAFNADSTVSIPIALQETGTFVVRITTNSFFETGTYSIALACPGPFAAVHLGAGSLSSGSIDAAAETDCFTFDGQMNEVVELTLVQTAGPAVPRATLFSPLGANLGTFDGNTLNTFTLAGTGRHTLKVRATNLVSTGSYNLGLERHGPIEPAAPPLACGQLFSDGFAAAGEVDYFTFDATLGDVVELTLVQTAGPALARGRLFSPADVDLGFFTTNELRAFTLAETGRFRIRIAATNLVSLGAYNLGFECRAPLGPVEAQLVCGDLVSNGFTAAGEVDYFTFDGTLGEVVELTLVQTAGPALARGRLFSPGDVDLGFFTTNELKEFTLAETGVFKIRVAATNLVSLGSYKLGLECRTPLGPVEDHLVCGDLVSNGFTTAGEVDYFTFDGALGDVVELTLVQTAGPALARGRLFSPADVDLGFFTTNELRAFTLAETGVFKIRVAASNLISPGSYNLGLECRNPLGPVEADLTCGQVVSNSFVAAGEVDYFTFEGTLNDVVDLTLTLTVGPALARARLFSPMGVDLGGFTANSTTQFVLPETGTYAIRVAASNLVSLGSYNLGLACP